jgi:hypothetical protein
MLLNLFLAILLDAFSEEDEEEREGEEPKKNKMEELEGRTLIEEINKYLEYAGKSKKKKNAFVAKKGGSKALRDKVILDESFDFDNIDEDKNIDSDEEEESKDLYAGIECEISYYFFKKDFFVRKFLRIITKHNMFENVIIVLIVLSTVKLVTDTYYMKATDDNIVVVVSGYLDYVFNIAFALETVTKSIAMGLA